MKKILCLGCFLLVYSCVFAQINIRDLEEAKGKFYTKDKKLYSGAFVFYNEDGKLQAKGTLKNGVLDGIATTYYPNGNIYTEITYKDGSTSGSNKEYYENGKLKQEVNTYEDKDDGKAIAYYESGEKHVESTFSKGVQVGDYIEYDKRGNVTRKLEFVNGKPSYGRAINDLVDEALKKARSFKNDEAIALYDKAIEINPSIAELYFNRGAAKSSKFSFEAAIADYDKAIQLYPDYKEAYANRGNAKINVFTSKGILEPTPEQTQSACEDFYKAKELGGGAAVEDMIYVYCERKDIKQEPPSKVENEPLVLFDNKKVTASSLSNVGPNDILEVSFIKSPEKTAEYGPDGKNGVVLITSIDLGVKSYQKILSDYSKEYAALVTFPDKFSCELNGNLLTGKPNIVVGKLFALKQSELVGLAIKKTGDNIVVSVTTKQ